MTRMLVVPAWRVNEGDVSPAGARVVSVQRDPTRGHVRIGLSTGGVLDVSGERRFRIAERAHEERARRIRLIGLFTAARRIGGRRAPSSMKPTSEIALTVRPPCAQEKLWKIAGG
jgi:hypothetical protein